MPTKKKATRARKPRIYVMRTVIETVVVACSQADAVAQIRENIAAGASATVVVSSRPDKHIKRASVQRLITNGGQGLDDGVDRTGDARETSPHELPTWRAQIDIDYPKVVR